MSKFIFLVVCKEGSINLREFLPRVDPDLRFDYVDGQLECYVEVEANSWKKAGALINNKRKSFNEASGEFWLIDEDYTMDKKSYSLYQEEPLGNYLSELGCW